MKPNNPVFKLKVKDPEINLLKRTAKGLRVVKKYKVTIDMLRSGRIELPYATEDMIVHEIRATCIENGKRINICSWEPYVPLLSKGMDYNLPTKI